MVSRDLRGRHNGELLFNEQCFSFTRLNVLWGWWCLLNIWIYLISLNCILEMVNRVNFTLNVFYPTKSIEKWTNLLRPFSSSYQACIVIKPRCILIYSSHLVNNIPSKPRKAHKNCSKVGREAHFSWSINWSIAVVSRLTTWYWIKVSVLLASGWSGSECCIYCTCYRLLMSKIILFYREVHVPC